jgi:hypothetical protein
MEGRAGGGREADDRSGAGLVPSLEARIGIPGESRTARLKDQGSIHHLLEAKDSDPGSAGRGSCRQGPTVRREVGGG